MSALPIPLTTTSYMTPTATFLTVTALLIYFTFLKSCFGTYNILTAITQERQRQSLEDRYNRLFTLREEAIYQISWAKQRGESREVLETMEVQLEGIDGDIDVIEGEIRGMYDEHGVGFKGGKSHKA